MSIILYRPDTIVNSVDLNRLSKRFGILLSVALIERAIKAPKELTQQR